ncbi:hypothetical protein [Microvirga soli]|uniref:hypothetical protein n=1 Tax=Microvirga soli TaxID=1854496 RepID=UPI00191DF235|nr:hypothetical protein [Microvirga soli]
MPAYLVSYDLKSGNPSPHATFLASAEPEGWLYICKSATKIFRLPNTTLWGVFEDVAAANAAFDRALAAAEAQLGRRIILEKRIVTRLGDWSARSDLMKAPEPRYAGRTDLETCRLHQLGDPFFT